MRLQKASVDTVRPFYAAHPHRNVVDPLGKPAKKRFWALWDDGQVVGAFYLHRHLWGLEQLGGVLVHPGRHGEGLGAQLMDGAARVARQSGARALVVGVHRRDEGLAAFYERAGFRTWVPFVPGGATPVVGPVSRLAAKMVGTPAGPDSIRLMARRLKPLK